MLKHVKFPFEISCMKWVGQLPYTLEKWHRFIPQNEVGDCRFVGALRYRGRIIPNVGDHFAEAEWVLVLAQVLVPAIILNPQSFYQIFQDFHAISTGKARQMQRPPAAAKAAAEAMPKGDDTAAADPEPGADFWDTPPLKPPSSRITSPKITAKITWPKITTPQIASSKSVSPKIRRSLKSTPAACIAGNSHSSLLACSYCEFPHLDGYIMLPSGNLI